MKSVSNRGIKPVNIYKPHIVMRQGLWVVSPIRRSQNHIPAGLTWRWFVANRVVKKLNQYRQHQSSLDK